MEMTIDDAMSHIKYGIIENNYPLQRDLGIAACNVALDTMRKYQKIKEIMDELNGDFYGSYLKDREVLEKIYEVVDNGND